MTTTHPVVNSRIGKWVGRHRFIAFVALTYGMSWSLWLIAALGGGQVPFLLGARSDRWLRPPSSRFAAGIPWPPGSDPSGIGVCRCSGGFRLSACRLCCTPLSHPSCS
jgi:hypothetical protein